jgi:hypothetical protein
MAGEPTVSDLPTEMVERAAQAAFAALHLGVDWTAISDAGREHWRHLARKVLAAALSECALHGQV